MAAGIDGLGLNPNTIAEAAETTAPEPQTTKVDGESMEVQPSIESLVEDAQEETTVLFQEKASTTLGRREAKTRGSSRLDEIAKKYLQKVWSTNPAEKFQQTLESLKKMGKPTPAQIRQLLEQALQGADGGGSESGLLLALEEALAAEGGHDDLLAAVRDAKSELGGDLRKFYEEQVKTYENVVDVYKQLLGDYGQEDFLKATDMMIHQLGDELQSQGGTADKSRIKATVDSLYNLEVARNTYSAFAGLVSKMQSQFGLFQSAI